MPRKPRDEAPAPETPDVTPAPEAPEFDPFGRHRRFAAGTAVASLPRAVRDRPIQPIEPLDTGADRLVDFEALERLASFQGLLHPSRPMRDEELSDETTEALQEREPQYILRNIGRVEREIDLAAKLEVTRTKTPYGLAAEPPRLRLEPLRPALLDSTTLDAVRDRQRHLRWHKHEAVWNRHFCKELRETWTGPFWRYDPDGPRDAEP